MSFSIGTSSFIQHGPRHTLSSYGEEGEGKAFSFRLLFRMMGYLKPHRLKMLSAFVLMVAGSGLTILTPYLIKIAIDEHIAGGNLIGLDRIALVLAATFMVLYGVTAGHRYLLSWVGQRVLAALREQLFGHLQDMHIGYHDKHIIGATVSVVINDVAIINEFLSQGMVTFIGDILLLIGIIVVMITMNPLLALLTFTIFPVMILTTHFFARKARAAFSKTRSRIAAVVGDLAENIAGMKVIQAFVQENGTQEKFNEVNQSNRDAHIGAMRLSFVFIPTVQILGIVATAVVLWFGSRFVTSGVLTIGTVVAFLAYVTRFFQPIQEISQIYTTMQAAMAGAEKVINLLDTVPAVRDIPGAAVMPPIKGRVELKKIFFHYKEDVPVLEDINLVVDPGKTVALVGQTGAGKTTLADLVARFYDVTQGTISVDGIDIRKVTQQSFRRQLGIVSQDPFLFSGTVADNICFGKPGADKDAMIRAASLANAHDFIERLPEGYDTYMQERAANLSTGQRQLICIARAILADPRILILDEATASVDTLTEGLIQEALARLFEGRTSLVIAHRLSTVRNADRIYVLDKGKLVEEGTHSTLIELGGIYRDLYERQFIKASEET